MGGEEAGRNASERRGNVVQIAGQYIVDEEHAAMRRLSKKKRIRCQKRARAKESTFALGHPALQSSSHKLRVPW
jgi:hypothetical protein